MDVTPSVPESRQLIDSYGDARFRISGTVHEGSVLVFPERTLAWPVTRFDEVTLESLAAVRESVPDLLLLGCGPKVQLVPKAFRQALREVGIVVEPMDTGAACRTFNVLMTEERRAAAALIAV